MKKKFAITAILTIVLLFVIASCVSNSAQAASNHRHHVKAKVCAQQYKHWGSKKFKQCKKQGWYYERGSYPASTETTPWTMVDYVLVYGPNGRLWVDTAGFYTYPNVR